MYHEIACLLAATDAQTGIFGLPLAVWVLLFAMSAPAFGVLSFLAIRIVVCAALREELDDLHRRLDENAAAVNDLKMNVYQSSSRCEAGSSFTLGTGRPWSKNPPCSATATWSALYDHNHRTAGISNP
jgi:hypothetical protein